MRLWPLGAAAVFLAAVLISACNSYLLGNMSRAEGKRMAPRPGRPREPSGTKQERLHLSRQKREMPCENSHDGCCTECPPGKFLKNCTCETCGDGTYLEHKNSLGKCLSCINCIFDAHQVVVKKCTPEHNRECGCEQGYLRINDHDDDNQYFSCEPCTDCATLNKQSQTDWFKPVYLLLCLPCLLLLGASVIYYKRRCATGKSYPAGIHTLVNSTCIDTLLAAAGTASCTKNKPEEPTEFPLFSIPSQGQSGLLQADPSPHRSLLQGRRMYSVIDVVPVRRWKEFMRGLGLRDGEIEAVELEHAQLREQQYEMLKRWRQQQGAAADAIFAVLEDMQLGGCAQELREQLQPSNGLPSL